MGGTARLRQEQLDGGFKNKAIKVLDDLGEDWRDAVADWKKVSDKAKEAKTKVLNKMKELKIKTYRLKGVGDFIIEAGEDSLTFKAVKKTDQEVE